MLIWDGLQVHIPETMEPVVLDRGFIRLAGSGLPTVEFRFSPGRGRFDPGRDGARILRAAGLAEETLRSCHQPWAACLDGSLYCASRLYVFQFRASRGVVAVLFADLPPADMVKMIFASLVWLPAEEWRSWCCYDMSFAVPPQHQLQSAIFRPGHFHLAFAHGPRKLTFDRLAPADVLLGKKDLVNWSRYYLSQGVHRDAQLLPLSLTELEVRKKPSRWYRILPWLPGLAPPLRGAIRHLAGENKILIITDEGPESVDETYQRIRASYGIAATFKS